MLICESFLAWNAKYHFVACNVSVRSLRKRAHIRKIFTAFYFLFIFHFFLLNRVETFWFLFVILEWVLILFKLNHDQRTFFWWISFPRYLYNIPFPQPSSTYIDIKLKRSFDRTCENFSCITKLQNLCVNCTSWYYPGNVYMYFHLASQVFDSLFFISPLADVFQVSLPSHGW